MLIMELYLVKSLIILMPSRNRKYFGVILLCVDIIGVFKLYLFRKFYIMGKYDTNTLSSEIQVIP